MKIDMPVFGERLTYIYCSYFQITSTPRQSFSKKSRLQLSLFGEAKRSVVRRSHSMQCLLPHICG